MPLALPEWHARCVQQATWTESLRRALLAQFPLPADGCILEVGCGTGAILGWLQSALPADALQDNRLRDNRLLGVDFHLPSLQYARKISSGYAHNAPQPTLSAADAFHLPLADDSCALVCCHFLLLWLPDAVAALREMRRVCKPDGWVMAFAEPDHAARVDFPAELHALGDAQTAALVEQGAQPQMGRQLAAVFAQAGITVRQWGVLGGQWNGDVTDAAEEGEWAQLTADLQGRVSHQQLDAWRQLDAASRKDGTRALYVPTFYAAGQPR